MAAASPAYAEHVLTASETTVLTVVTRPIDDPGPLLDLLPEQGGLVWVSQGQGLVGWGAAAQVSVAGPGRFAEAEAWWQALTAAARIDDPVGTAGSGLVSFGSFAFDGDLAASVLIVPEVVVGHRDGVWWLTTSTGDHGSAEPRLPARPPVRPPAGLRFEDDEASGAAWAAAVGGAVARIESGELDKVVLARDLHARTAEPVDLRWPLARLARDYPGCWTFSVDGLLGATPEVLVRLRDGIATSRVLAGTLRRSGDSNEDGRRGDAFPRSIKDVEEHGYAVRSVADALGLHSTDLDVPADPFVLELPNVMHLASDVTATVLPGTTSLQLAAALHPSAAVCGTPTDVAFDVIRQVEKIERGRYAGPVGWTDATGDGEWGIALRCASVDPHDAAHLRLFAGCGIVAGSTPREELAESVAKLMPMRSALEG
ncbi:MAG: isochorismate synthase [Frankiales bacterium]|nr:isochorismate synthase [Frankiales bacterium]